MTSLETILLGLVSRHCRGPAAARKIWRLIEDLRGLGLDVTSEAVVVALAGLRREGLPVAVTDVEPPAAYLVEGRRAPRRGRAWRGRPRRRPAGTVPRRPADRALAAAESAYRTAAAKEGASRVTA